MTAQTTSATSLAGWRRRNDAFRWMEELLANDPTLMAWHANFEAAWPGFADMLGERFHPMWRYYLLSRAGAFRARDIQLWQWVLSKSGAVGGYQRPA